MELREYLKLKKQIEDKYKGDMSSLESLWVTYGSKDSADHSKRNISDSVRVVLKAVGESFTIGDVFKGLKDLGCADIKMQQLSNAMNRLLKRGEIELVEAGKGRQPSKYKLADPKKVILITKSTTSKVKSENFDDMEDDDFEALQESDEHELEDEDEISDEELF